jgi:hypothetical protein
VSNNKCAILRQKKLNFLIENVRHFQKDSVAAENMQIIFKNQKCPKSATK